MQEKHTFALWYADLSEKMTSEKTVFSVNDTTLYHRICSVIRLQKGDEVILFDQRIHALCMINTISKKEVIVTTSFYNQNKRSGVNVTVLLPLLKKDDYENTLYGLSALGVTQIQLLITQKTHRNWWNKTSDYQRSQRIVCAGAEQAKYFCLPKLIEPVSLDQYIQYDNKSDTRFVADPDGLPMRDLICIKTMPQEVSILIGPEAGFTAQEKKVIIEHNFKPYRLTPTILKAEQATLLSAGIFRSVFY